MDSIIMSRGNKMKNSMKTKINQQGFTLIELVVVIVILAILAVTAAPKFIDLQADANSSTIKGLEGAIYSASTLIRSKFLIEGKESVESDTVSALGTDIAIVYGYPAATEAVWKALLEIDTNDFEMVEGYSDYGSIFFKPAGSTIGINGGWIPMSDLVATEEVNCFVYYFAADAADDLPVIGSRACTWDE